MKNLSRGRPRKYTIDAFIEAKALGMPHTGDGSSELTLKAYKSALNQIEQAVNRHFFDIVGRDVETYLQYAQERKLSAATINKTLVAAKQAFDWAIATGHPLQQNPFTAVRRQKVTRKLPRILTQEEAERIFAATRELGAEKRASIHEGAAQYLPWAQKDTTAKYELIFRLWYYGGLRLSEAIGLLKRDLRLDHVIIEGKGSKQRIVPLPPELMKQLYEWREANPDTQYMFYGENGRAYGVEPTRPMHPNQAYRIFKMAVERAGIERPDEITPHTLRHSFATRAAAKTGRLEVVQDLLGHADPKTTRIYVQLAQEDLQREYKKIWD